MLAGYLPKGAAYDGYEPNADAAAQAMVRKPGYIFMQKPEAIGYTVIVFADCCYYGDPVAMLDYGARHLAPGGRLIVTIYQRPQRWPNWLYALRGRMTNLRATAIVCAHIKRKGWTLLTDGVVPRPGGGEWRLLCVQP